MQERDWRLDTTVQSGIVTRSRGRAIRLFVELQNGRPPLGEFFSYSETRVGLGLRIDP
jgi:hypothetical protein